MKKLINELEAALKNYKLYFGGTQYDDGMISGIETTINIVRAHSPWHEVTELPERSEMRTISIDVILRNDSCKHNTRVVGYYHYSAGAWAYNDGDNYSPTHWAYLPEVKP